MKSPGFKTQKARIRICQISHLLVTNAPKLRKSYVIQMVS